MEQYVDRNPTEPGLYRVKIKNLGSKGLFSLWSGAWWYWPSASPLRAEEKAMRGELWETDVEKWKDAHERV